MKVLTDSKSSSKSSTRLKTTKEFPISAPPMLYYQHTRSLQNLCEACSKVLKPQTLSCAYPWIREKGISERRPRKCL